ncbi:hypothetical protein AMECASPLE_004333 [Ameca splendens]|uniref:Uncharacterized protein n=1 Tax=Ameca splendens TaxID=208324 RepID=A0ABV0Y9X6_9TELE
MLMSHPSMVHIHLSLQGRGDWCLPPAVERRGKSRTSRQSITRQHGDKQPCMHILVPKDKLERPIHLTVMFLHYESHLENMHTSCRKTPGWDLNPGLAVPLCTPR